MEITQARVRELFDYRDDGALIWKVSLGNRAKAGTRAGSVRQHGYFNIKIDGNKFLAHRLVFLWHHGYVPAFIDHVNGVPGDDRIENLRPATRSQNMGNRKLNANSRSGLKGVQWRERDSKWRARITLNGRQKELGLFDTAEKAHAAYLEAARLLHGEFARGA